MNRTLLSKRISSLLAEVSRLSNALCAMNTMDLQRYPENYELLSTDAALRAEQIALPDAASGLWIYNRAEA